MFWIVFIFAVFPQGKVDRICLLNREKGVVLNTGEEIGHCPAMGREFFYDKILFSGSRDFNLTFDKRDALYIGPGPDTFLIDTNYVQDGDIIIFGEGMLLVDNAELNLSGHLYAQNQGQAIFRNNAHLHFNQFYVGQYYVWLVDSSKFEATDAVVDANAVMHYIVLHDYCTYIARRVYFPDWTYRQVYEKSTLLLEDVAHVGDLAVYDSTHLHFIRCDTIMPWLTAPSGAVIDVQFPDPDSVSHFVYQDGEPGISGIGYSVSVDTCCRVWWSIASLRGCSLTVHNSEIFGCDHRLTGVPGDTFSLSGLFNYSFYSDLTMSLWDRYVRLQDTYVYWWHYAAMGDAVVLMDSCVFGELMGHESSNTYATRSTCDGACIHLGVTDTAFISFVDGKVLSYTSSYKYGTLLLYNVAITPLWPYQSMNLAHGHSYFLAINSFFEYEPEAMDTSLVMVAAIDSPPTGMIDTTIDVYGSAWIDVGPFNSITYDRYKLYWAYDGDTIWALIHESLSQVHSDIIAAWNTAGMSEGDYDLRLTVWDDAGDSLIAFGNITLQAQGVNENKDVGVSSSYLQIYPNPFSKLTYIKFQAPNSKSQVTMKIYDVSGRIVKSFNLTSCFLPLASAVSWDGTDSSGKRLSTGIYFCKLEAGDFKTMKKLILIR